MNFPEENVVREWEGNWGNTVCICPPLLLFCASAYGDCCGWYPGQWVFLWKVWSFAIGLRLFGGWTLIWPCVIMDVIQVTLWCPPLLLCVSFCMPAKSQFADREDVWSRSVLSREANCFMHWQDLQVWLGKHPQHRTAVKITIWERWWHFITS